MTLQLAEDIIAGMTTREGEEYPYAQLDIVRWNEEEESETPIVTVRALNYGQVHMEVDWHDDSYKENKEVKKFIGQAQNEVIMFVLFG